MITNETKEFSEWWNATFDPNETGRTRIAASHAFEAGKIDKQYREAIVNLQRAGLEVLKVVPISLRDLRQWSTPLIIASLDGDSQGERFIVRIERV